MRQFLSKTDVHNFAVAFDAEARKDLLTMVFVALPTLEAHGAHDVALPPSSALLEAAKKVFDIYVQALSRRFPHPSY
jgi:glycine cleavage system H lipoate-binding protein